MRYQSALIGLLAAGLPVAANAVIVKITSSFDGFVFANGSDTTAFNNDGKHTILTPSGPGQAAVDVSAFLTTDGSSSFVFEHDLVGNGLQLSRARTVLTVKITNDGATSEALRFDSQITPGHVALRQPFGTHNSFAALDFGVNLDGKSLYSLKQNFTSLTDTLVAGFTGLNGFSTYRDTSVNHLVAYDWWYSNINLLLGTFKPGQTKTLTYDLTTLISTIGLEGDPSNCPTAQISFGDPRSRGGAGGFAVPTSRRNAAAAASSRNAAPAETAGDGGCHRLNPVTYLPFRPGSTYISVVDAGTPLPDQPTPPPPINYDAVPEPAGFALFGVGALALALARRRG